jgi:hypothetical protein
MTEPIRSPHDIPNQPRDALWDQWLEARTEVSLAIQAGIEPDPNDLFAELAYGVRMAQELIPGRWHAVALLLRIGAVDSWSQLGTAMGLSETQARDGFHAWIAREVDFRRNSGVVGITKAEAEELYALSEAVA